MDRNSKCILTSYEEGSLVQATGIYPISKKVGELTVTKHKFAKNFKFPGEVTKVTTLSEKSVFHMTSEDGIPLGITKFQWARMTDTQRLRANLRDIAGTNNFTFELI